MANVERHWWQSNEISLIRLTDSMRDKIKSNVPWNENRVICWSKRLRVEEKKIVVAFSKPNFLWCRATCFTVSLTKKNIVIRPSFHSYPLSSAIWKSGILTIFTLDDFLFRFFPQLFHILHVRRRSNRKVTRALIIRIQQIVKVTLHTVEPSKAKHRTIDNTYYIASKTMSHSQLFMCVKIVAQRALWFSHLHFKYRTYREKRKRRNKKKKKNIDSINNNATDSTWHKYLHIFPSQIFHKTEKSNRFFASYIYAPFHWGDCYVCRIYVNSCDTIKFLLR